MFYAVEKGKGCKLWNGCTVVIPTPSVGNVSQLAIDLIISTLKLTKIGYLYDDSLLPIVGNDPFAEKTSTKSCNLVTGCEVYGSQEHKIVVVQLRSQIIRDKRKQFRQMFTKWAKEAEFSDVIILSGSFAHLRVDKQLCGMTCRSCALTYEAAMSYLVRGFCARNFRTHLQVYPLLSRPLYAPTTDSTRVPNLFTKVFVGSFFN